MTSAKINPAVIAQRAEWIKNMLLAIEDLPLKSEKEFLNERHYSAAAESYLRRALEALFDIGRHILSKAFASPLTEYKAIAQGLAEHKVLPAEQAEILREMAGYRNRLTHFYHEIGPAELYEICRDHLDDIRGILSALVKWTAKES